MKRGIIVFLLGVLTLILYNTFFMNLSILGIKVDLVLIFIVCISILMDEIEIFFISLFLGILKDAFFPYVFGINTICYILISYTVNYIENKIYKDTVIIPMFFTAISTVFKGFIYYMFLFISKITDLQVNIFIQTVVLEMAFNSIVSILIYNIIKKFFHSDLLKKEWNF